MGSLLSRFCSVERAQKDALGSPEVLGSIKTSESTIAMRTVVGRAFRSSKNLEFISSIVNALESEGRRDRMKSGFLVNIFS